MILTCTGTCKSTDGHQNIVDIRSVYSVTENTGKVYRLTSRQYYCHLFLLSVFTICIVCFEIKFKSIFSRKDPYICAYMCLSQMEHYLKSYI